MDNKIKQKSTITILLIIIFFILIAIADSIHYIKKNDTLSVFTGLILASSILGIPLVLFRKRIKLYLYILFPLLLFSGVTIIISLLYNMRISPQLLLLIANTNEMEAGELFSYFQWHYLFILIIFITLGIVAIRKSSSEISLKSSLIISIASFITFLSYYTWFNTYKYVNHQSIHLAYNFYPFNIYYNIKGFYVHQKKVDKDLDDLKGVFYDSVVYAPKDQRQVFVLIIGETSRYENWSLNGYHRETNPLLSNIDNLVNFSNVSASGATTHLSVPLMLTGLPPHRHQENMSFTGLIGMFKQAGFKTYAFTNNSDNNGVIDKHYEIADSMININSRLFKENREGGDVVLARLLNDILEKTEDDCFFILHSNGSHFNYTTKYPKSFEIFKPTEFKAVSSKYKDPIMNAYDNSILYTDYFLDTVVKIINNKDISSLMLYSSDHGENIFDTKDAPIYHPPVPTYYTAHIPFLIYGNSSFVRNNPVKWQNIIQNRKKKISNNMVFETLIDLADIEFKGQNFKNSIANDSFIESKQLILGDEGIVYEFDSLKQN